MCGNLIFRLCVYFHKTASLTLTLVLIKNVLIHHNFSYFRFYFRLFGFYSQNILMIFCRRIFVSCSDFSFGNFNIFGSKYHGFIGQKHVNSKSIIKKNKLHIVLRAELIIFTLYFLLNPYSICSFSLPSQTSIGITEARIF